MPHFHHETILKFTKSKKQQIMQTYNFKKKLITSVP